MKPFKYVALVSLAFASGICPVSAEELIGKWLAEDGDTLIIEEDRFVLQSEDKDQVFGILHQAEDRYLVLRACVPREVRLELKKTAEGVRLQAEGAPVLEEKGTFRRTQARNEESLAPETKIGEPVPLSEKEKQKISAKLVSLFEQEQDLLKSGDSEAALKALRVDILNYLRGLIQQVGWIDAQRFGNEVSYKAVVLIKHVGDVGLRSAVLPHIERDFGSPGPDSMAFAIVYDSIQLDLGHPQKYGTQLGNDPEGNPVVCLLESLPSLEEYRKSLGLPPISEYQELASRELFDGREVSILGDATQLVDDFEAGLSLH